MLTLASVDVVVSGGGVGGAACAAALAEAGRQVVIVERRGALGWEIGRARRVFLGLERAAEHSNFLGEFHRRLVEHGAYKAGVIHAAIAELVFDRIVAERGVEPLFHVWPVAAARESGACRGLVVGTKEGYALIEAPVVVETDERGRLVDPSLREPVERTPVRRTLVLGGVDAGALADALADNERRAALANLCERERMEVRPVDGPFVRVDVSLPHAEYAERERAFPHVVRRAVEALRACDAAFAGAGVVYIGDDEWGGPDFAVGRSAAGAGEAPLGALFTDVNGELQTRAIGAGDLVFRDGIVLAGPWLSRAREASDTEEVQVLNRVILGEAAARFVTSSFAAIMG